jgi:hypothetical protein
MRQFRQATMWSAATTFCCAAFGIAAVDAIYLGASHKAVSVNTGFAFLIALLAASASRLGVLRSSFAERKCFDVWSTLAVFAAFLSLYSATRMATTPYDEQVRQAYAFLHGHTYIDAQGALEHAQIGAYSYALHPPLPAILLMPFVAFSGPTTDQTTFSVIFGAIDVALAWRLLARFRLTAVARIWLTIFFGAGTILWSETINGNTWALPETTAVMFTLLALSEAFGPARPLYLGIYAAAAALARYELAIAGLSYAILACRRGRSFRELIWMLPGFATAAMVFIGLNEARYASFFDQGVMITGPKGAPVFGLRYLLGNINTIFFMEPQINDRFPYFHPVFGGQSVTFTSPAFVLALRPSLSRLEPLLMLLTAFVISIPSLLCYANGFAQFGTRHYLQVFPFLLVMMAMGMRRADQLTKILISISIIFIAFGITHVKIWGLA